MGEARGSRVYDDGVGLGGVDFADGRRSQTIDPYSITFRR
jgi:hypothetical protein